MALTLCVITPDRIAFDHEVNSVTIPGVDGQIGILPRHAPMIAALDTGLLRYKENGQTHVMFVSGWFSCEIEEYKVLVLPDPVGPVTRTMP